MDRMLGRMGAAALTGAITGLVLCDLGITSPLIVIVVAALAWILVGHILFPWEPPPCGRS